MKKLLTFALACLLITALALPASAENMGYTYSAPYGTATVDGVVDAAYDAAEWADIEMRMNDSAGEHAKFKLIHDDEYLYFVLQWNDTAPTGNENVKAYIHEHTDACTAGAGCADYHQYQFVTNGQVWCHVDPKSEDDPDTEGNALMTKLAGENVTANDGTVYTMEFSMKLHNGVSNLEGIRLELLFEDYNPDWQGPHAWNTIAGNGDYTTEGALVTLLAGEKTEDTTAKEEENTTAKEEENTTAKQEENTTAKQENTTANEPADTSATTAPTTADMGLALAAVVMACAAMLVLRKKR